MCQEANNDSPLWKLDDAAPAGPYSRRIHPTGLRLLALATIKQATFDARRKTPGLRAESRVWLNTTARTWLHWLGVARGCGENGEVHRMIYGPPSGQMVLNLDEQQREFDEEDCDDGTC